MRFPDAIGIYRQPGGVPVAATPTPSPTPTPTPTPTPAPSFTVYLVPSGSQSNQSGRVAQDNLDPASTTNLYEFGGVSTITATYRKIVPMGRVLDHPDYYGGTSDRVSPGVSYMQGFHTQDPSNVYIAVPCADGTPLTVNDGGGNSWRSGSNANTDPGGNRFEFMMDQLSRAYTAVQNDARFTGATIKTILSWVGGEADAQIQVTRTAYRTAFIKLIDDFRTRAAAMGITGGSTAQVIVGSLLPRLFDPNSSDYNAHAIGQPENTYASVNAAQVDAALARSNVLYALGPNLKGYVGAAGTGDDTLHYQPAEVTRMQGASIAAIRNDTTVPVLSTKTSLYSTVGRPLLIPLYCSMLHWTVEIMPGLDGALFGLTDAYISPGLTWTGGGTGPAIGTYSVNLRPRSGAGVYGSTFTVPIPVVAVGQVPFSSFFTHGERGKAWDATDLTSLYQDVAGTTASTGTTLQRIGKMLDKSGKGEHWFAAGDNNTRPAYTVDSDGKGLLNFTSGQARALYSAGATTTDTDPAVTTIVGLAVPAQTGNGTANIIVNNPTAGGLGAITPMRTNDVNPNIEMYARNSGSANLQTLPILNGALDGTKRIITSVMNGGNQPASIRDATNRSAGGGSGGYVTIVQDSWTSTTGADRTVMMPSLNGGGYAGLTIGRVAAHYERANIEDRVAYLMALAALP